MACFESYGDSDHPGWISVNGCGNGGPYLCDCDGTTVGSNAMECYLVGDISDAVVYFDGCPSELWL